MTDPPPSLARHTARGSAYSLASSAATIALGLLRTYLMVRFLLPDQIGLAALALFYTNLGMQLGGVGLGQAYIQKQDSGEAARKTFYTFHLLVRSAGLLLAIGLAPLIARFYPTYTGLGTLIAAYATISFLRIFSQPQVTFLKTDLSFGRMALLDLLGGLATTIVGPGMAYLGFGVWAVLGEYAGGVLTRFALIHFWIKPFRPRIGWDRAAAGWLWGYGKSVWASTNLTFLIEHFDDFWVGTALGKSPLGLYSKAYEFSRYPRRVVANPILSVFFPTFAHIQEDRRRLSRAFFRATSLIVRAGALFSLIVILAAPEAFRLFLPEAWLPMRLTFQLMIVYTFLDPLGQAAQRLLMATGRPDIITRTRWVQLVVFVPSVIAAAAWRGVEGVALAADLMVLVGTFLLFRSTLSVVDYSPRALWRWPVAALAGISALFTLAAPRIEPLPDAGALMLKLVLIPALYTAILWLFERRQLQAGLAMIRGVIQPSEKT